MTTRLTGPILARLLDRLDPDRARAGERYEELRRTLLRFFEWRGAPFPEEQADETLDRVAQRLADGVEVKQIGGYCYEVARLVFLETRKRPDLKRVSLDDPDTTPAAGEEVGATEKEARMVCLDGCLSGLPTEAHDLIVAYYRDDTRGRIVARRELADRLGLRPEALANRAQRLRDKLERCVTACLKTGSPT